MTEHDLEEIFLAHHTKGGFIVTDEFSSLFGYKPDIVLKSQSKVKAYIFRGANTIPQDILNAFSEITPIDGFVVEKFIVFSKKPLKREIEKVHALGVGISYVVKDKIHSLIPSVPVIESLAEEIAVKPAYEMPTTVIFFSSVEEIDERSFGRKIVQSISSKWTKSIFANLIERDNKLKTMTWEDLKKEILVAIIKDEFFLGILTEEHSKAVHWEIEVALENKSFDKIILLVKNNAETRTAWEQLLKHIEVRLVMNKKTVVFKKYDDLIDFQVILHAEILDLLSKKHKENGATFL